MQYLRISPLIIVFFATAAHGSPPDEWKAKCSDLTAVATTGVMQSASNAKYSVDSSPRYTEKALSGWWLTSDQVSIFIPMGEFEVQDSGRLMVSFGAKSKKSGVRLVSVSRIENTIKDESFPIASMRGLEDLPRTLFAALDAGFNLDASALNCQVTPQQNRVNASILIKNLFFPALLKHPKVYRDLYSKKSITVIAEYGSTGERLLTSFIESPDGASLFTYSVLISSRKVSADSLLGSLHAALGKPPSARTSPPDWLKAARKRSGSEGSLLSI